MELCKKQPQELAKSEHHEICPACNGDMDITMMQSTTYKGKWYHIWCWKKLVGI